jgi:hypothetical protein
MYQRKAGQQRTKSLLDKTHKNIDVILLLEKNLYNYSLISQYFCYFRTTKQTNMKNLLVIATVATCLIATTLSFAQTQPTDATTPKAVKKEFKAEKKAIEKKPMKAAKKDMKAEKKEEKAR